MNNAQAAARWEHFEHGSDVGIRGRGRSPAEAFEQAALAMMGVITDPGTIRSASKSVVECSAPDMEQLFITWLNALICEMSIRGMLFGRFEVRIAGSGLFSEAWGEKIDPARHQPAAEVKAATRAELEVRQLEGGLWIAQCVVDV